MGMTNEEMMMHHHMMADEGIGHGEMTNQRMVQGMDGMDDMMHGNMDMNMDGNDDDPTTDDHVGGHGNGHASSPTHAPTGSSNMSSQSGHLGHGVSGEAVSNGFCTTFGGTGMVMFMDGFQFALRGDRPCINLYFPGWTLDSRGKFIVAMFGVILLAIGTEGISKWRHNVSRSARRRRDTLSKSDRQQLAFYQTGLHGLHAFTGYILMLATMTFSMELLLSVIVGLVIGYVSFGGDSYSHVTTNPCCAFLEDEANERVIVAGDEGSSEGDGGRNTTDDGNRKSDVESSVGGTERLDESYVLDINPLPVVNENVPATN